VDIIATDGNDIVPVEGEDDLIHNFVIGIANCVDTLAQMNHSADVLIAAIQMTHRGNVINHVSRHAVLHGSNNSSIVTPVIF
jgi:hypothetical protein